MCQKFVVNLKLSVFPVVGHSLYATSLLLKMEIQVGPIYLQDCRLQFTTTSSCGCYTIFFCRIIFRVKYCSRFLIIRLCLLQQNKYAE